MTNYSRTTLRELKKRYLNILKKCLLANLMAFSFVLPSMAETVTNPATNEELLEALLDPTKRVEITNAEAVYEILLNKNIHISQYHGDGGAILNIGYVKILNDEDYLIKFQNADTIGRGGVIFNENGTLVFDAFVEFSNNKNNSKTGAVISNIGGDIIFNKNVIFKNNNAQTSNAGVYVNTGTVTFNNMVFFIENKSAASGGAIFNADNTGKSFFNGYTFFKNNSAAQSGGVMRVGGYGVDFNGKTVFINNEADYGGALFIGRKTIFNDTAIFIGNKAHQKTGQAAGSYSGALQIQGEIYFNSNFVFIDNIGKNQKNDMTIVGLSGVYFNNPKKTTGIIGSGISGLSNRHIIFKSGSGLVIFGDDTYNEEYLGEYNQVAGMTIGNSTHFLQGNNAINGGELKTHGSEIAYKAVVGQNVDESGAVLSAGKVMHYTTKPEMEVNATTLANITFAGEDMGATIGVGTYNKTEQEKEIALVDDRLVEYIDENGKIINYQATDKLFTIDTLASGERTKFKVTGALPNEKGNKIAFANGIVEIDESIGKTGAIYELDNSILETTSVQNKVLSKNMILGEAQEYSFTELEVADGTTLDVKNKKVSTDTLTMNDNAILNIDLNSVTDHGKMTIGEVQNAEKGKLSLKLTKGLAQENGVYQVFDEDNNLTLQENKLFNIKDLENGAYEVSKKTSENLMKDFDMSASESAVAVAFIESESSHKVFNQVQEEMLEALQSEDKAQVQKAKKALSAVGSKEHPVEQSVASEHLVALQNVVQAELHGAGVGRAGGDTDPRAKVYIKGLYDRTKSSMGEGFRARSKGAVLGVQSEVTEDLTLGVGYATSQTTAKEDLRRTEVDTNTGFISAHYQPNAWWVSGLATFSRGEYEEEKQILSSMGKASYNVDSWGAQVMTGYDIKLKNAIITPEVGLRYLSVKQEGYTDTLGTTVSGTQSDYLTALVGVKGTWDMGAIRPTAGVTVGYDIISDDVSALNTLANGASYTVNGEALDRLSTTVTTGVEADLGERTTLKLEYSGTYRKEYVDHSGMIKFELRF